MAARQFSDSSGDASTDPRQQLLSRFEDAWHDPGHAPRIEEFVKSFAAARATTEAARRALLEELVQIDLECRWRQGTLAAKSAPSGARFPLERPRLEDYVATYPDLGPLGQLPVELIAEEYRVRQRWGDHPGHGEYAGRFVQQWPNLRAALVEVDGELAEEYGYQGSLPRPRASSLAGSERMEPTSSITSVAALLDLLRQVDLLDVGQVNELADRFRNLSEPRALAQHLIKVGWLTPYQVNQLFQGRGRDLMVGPYLVLERLGEGGTGQVFKARHRKKNRLVALKVIRKDLLTDTELVGRFCREVQILSQLDHPNIVRGYDSGPAGGSHYLAMEYVEGTDLGELVKRGGPMPVQQACAYMRQAALGLQHAHERGLVHRDIKPHNLIMSVRDGLVKVADLGLARLPRTANSEFTAALTGANGTGTLTPANAVLMGTVDYLAPEQALDFHRADIRADIYSLGCTFYFLLSGQPPFAGATLTEKLIRHQQAEPPSVAGARKDVPPELDQVIRRMLAKRPTDRFQTPAEIGTALAALRFPGDATGAALTAGGQPLRRLRSIAARAFRGLVPKGLSRRRLLVVGMVGILILTILTLVLSRGGPSGLDRFPGKPGDVVAVVGGPNQKRGGNVTFTPDGKLMAYIGWGATDREQLVCLWDAETKKERTATVPNERLWLGFAPDGKTLVLRCTGHVTLWDIPSFQQRAKFSAADGSEIAAISIAPDSRTLAAGCGSGAVELWDIASGTVRHRYPKVAPSGWFEALWFAPDGQTLAMTPRDGPVFLWTVAGNQERRPTDWTWLAFSPNNRIAAVWNRSGPVKLADAADGKELASLDAPAEHRSIAFSPDGKLLAQSVGDVVRLWDVSRAKEPKVIKDLGGPRTSYIAFVPNRPMVASISYDEAIYVWDLRNSQVLLRRPTRWCRALTMTADGRYMAAWSHYGDLVEIIRLPTGEKPGG